MKGKETGANKDIIDDRQAEGDQNLGSLDWRRQATSTVHAAGVPPSLRNVHETSIADKDCTNNLHHAFKQLVEYSQPSVWMVIKQLVGYSQPSVWMVIIQSLQQDESMNSMPLLRNARNNAAVKLIKRSPSDP